MNWDEDQHWYDDTHGQWKPITIRFMWRWWAVLMLLLISLLVAVNILIVHGGG